MSFNIFGKGKGKGKGKGSKKKDISFGKKVGGGARSAADEYRRRQKEELEFLFKDD